MIRAKSFRKKIRGPYKGYMKPGGNYQDIPRQSEESRRISEVNGAGLLRQRLRYGYPFL